MHGEKEGPRLTLECFGCKWHRQERDYGGGEDDFRNDHYCKHPESCAEAEDAGGRWIGSLPGTPDWCPAIKGYARLLLPLPDPPPPPAA